MTAKEHFTAISTAKAALVAARKTLADLEAAQTQLEERQEEIENATPETDADTMKLQKELAGIRAKAEFYPGRIERAKSGVEAAQERAGEAVESAMDLVTELVAAREAQTMELAINAFRPFCQSMSEATAKAESCSVLHHLNSLPYAISVAFSNDFDSALDQVLEVLGWAEAAPKTPDDLQGKDCRAALAEAAKDRGNPKT